MLPFTGGSLHPLARLLWTRGPPVHRLLGGCRGIVAPARG